MAEMDKGLLEQLVRSARGADLAPEDAITMVTLLARRRRTSRAYESEGEALLFSSVILCFVFDPVKSKHTNYVRAMPAFRRQFRGIYTDIGLQSEFEAQLSDALLTADTIQDAIEHGIEALFLPQYAAK